MGQLQLATVVCVLLNVVTSQDAVLQQGAVPCYSYDGRAQRCTPPFENAAYNLDVEATNTCGMRERTEYCLQVQGNTRGGSSLRATQSCEYCDNMDPHRRHHARFLTDYSHNTEDEVTWWQSETMYEGIQHPQMVNLTLHLGKAYDITYVRLKFRSSRPESFAIYKRTVENGPWIPYGYYSASCENTYGKTNNEIITSDDEAKAVCTNEYSDISPLMGGSVAFSTLVGRPGAFQFQDSPVLQEFVTATDIRISLNRINTFGDEVFGDHRVLKSYFYAISDFAVGGMCKCNGHASLCVPSTGQNLDEIKVCQCEHNTHGDSCEECKPFYNNKPWQRATPEHAHECEACNCNNLANRCFFDEELYTRTGNGGHCLDCMENTAGPNCERCKDNFYRRNEYDRCMPCVCSPVGSESLQCDNSGRCRCKDGVTGEKCDRCAPNHFEFGPSGCRQCACAEEGSLDNNPTCLADTGICSCKENVEGQNCDQCKLGFFNLDLNDPWGCSSCFCYLHASTCTTAAGFYKDHIESTFNSGDESWGSGYLNSPDITDLAYNGLIGLISVAGSYRDSAYFIAPDKFLGDQRFSYNQFLTFMLRIGEDGSRVSREDIIIEGAGFRVTAPIYAQANPQPSTLDQEYRFLLHEHRDNQWMPDLTAQQFIEMLSNVTAIKIRASFTPEGFGFLDDVFMGTAHQGSAGSESAAVEQCNCMEGYVGQFCESCMAGYRRDPPYGGPMSRCAPCNCNGHSEFCDIDSGRCRCEHHTSGEMCERCEPGYYGYALAGTPDDCEICPCPDNGECVELLDGEIACINCREGHTGNRCELCEDGYFGDPEGRYGPRQPCQKCTCNDNIDPNAVANCNTTSGECLKCVYNTWGSQCEDCLPGYYGSALELPKGQCLACECNPEGSQNVFPGEPIHCDRDSGQCPCLPNVNNRKCEKCVEGYWNIDSAVGCEACRCDRTGSYNSSCVEETGQCYCRDGVTGQLCNECKANHWGFDFQGCSDCMCDPEGSDSLSCDLITGQCSCLSHIEGKQCDHCEENKHNITAGCIDCPPCYTLVLEKVREHRAKLEDLRSLIDTIGRNPQAINDTNFHETLRAVNESVNALLRDARDAIGSDSSLLDQLEAIRNAVSDLENDCAEVTTQLDSARNTSESVVTDVEVTEELLDEAERRLQEAEDYMNTEGKYALNEAKRAQEQFGQQSDRMTEIAQQAREEAIRQEEEAAAILKTAEHALNVSQEAYRVAQEAFQKPSDIAEQVRQLEREVMDTDRLYDQVYAQASQARNLSKIAYDEALMIYSEAQSITLPTISAQDLSDEAARISEEVRGRDGDAKATRIAQEAVDLIEQHFELMEDVAETTGQAETLLEEAITQQQISDELLADANAALGIAEEAVGTAEHTVREANQTLITLTEFNSTVHTSKSEADDAMSLIVEIEELINLANEKTDQAVDGLAGAKADAELARDIAQEAKEIAETASQEAGEVRSDADMTRDEADVLEVDSERLSSDVNNAELDLETYEQTAAEDQRLADEALDSAAQAISTASTSSTKVRSALETVNSILDQLTSLDTIDLARIEELERNLEDANRLFQEADLDVNYQLLVQSSEQQQRWVNEYTDELFQLQRDVENINQIQLTIPETCYNRVELEPTIPTP